MSPASKSSSDNANDDHGYLETENYASTELDIPNPSMDVDVDVDDDASSVVEGLVGSTTSLSSSSAAPLPRLLRPRNDLPYEQESRNVMYRLSDINHDRAYAELQTISRQRQECDTGSVQAHAPVLANYIVVHPSLPPPTTSKRKRQVTEATLPAVPCTTTVATEESGSTTDVHAQRDDCLATSTTLDNDGVAQTTAAKKFVLDLDADELEKLQQDPYAYLGVDLLMFEVKIEIVGETSPPRQGQWQLVEASTTHDNNGNDATFSVAGTASPPSTSAPAGLGLQNLATATTRPVVQNVTNASTSIDRIDLLNESKGKITSISSGKTACGPKDAKIILPLARHGVNLTAESREIVCNALLDRCLPNGTLKKGARNDVRRLLYLNMATVDRIWSLILASVTAKGVVDMTFDTNKSKLPFCLARATLALQRVLAQRNGK